MAQLILKRGDPSRRRDNDYDVLEDGKVVGRIFHLEAAAPEGRPWMSASGDGGLIERAAHGYEPTREAAMRRSPKAGGGNPPLTLAGPLTLKIATRGEGRKTLGALPLPRCFPDRNIGKRLVDNTR